MTAKRIEITSRQFQEFRDLQQRQRWDWPAVFSSNSKGEIWAFKRYGQTPREERANVRDLCPLLDLVADRYERHREERGRFFIDERGAFFKSPDREWVQFIEWNSRGTKLQVPTKAFEPRDLPSQAEMWEQMERRRREALEQRRFKRSKP